MKRFHFEFLTHVERIGHTKFRRFYCMSSSCFEKLIALLQPDICRIVPSSVFKTDRPTIRYINVLAITLRLLASASSLDVSMSYGLSFSRVNSVLYRCFIDIHSRLDTINFTLTQFSGPTEAQKFNMPQDSLLRIIL